MNPFKDKASLLKVLDFFFQIFSFAEINQLCFFTYLRELQTEKLPKADSRSELGHAEVEVFH